MATSSNYYIVGVILSQNINFEDYELTVGNQNCEIIFYNTTNNVKECCDLVITDKKPNNLSSIPSNEKECRGTILVINKLSNPLIEHQYEEIFNRSKFIKYKALNVISQESILNSIYVELIKYMVINGKLSLKTLIFNKHTRVELFTKIIGLSWLLIPFFLIIIFIVAKYVLSQFGHSLSFLCWFVDYNPDCKKDILSELKLLTLIYAFFNLTFYYNYILSIFDNINNDVFQSINIRRYRHKLLQLFIPVILLISAFLIFKELFIFKYSIRIAEAHNIIDIRLILDLALPFLKDYYLIFYFLLLDSCLWLMTRNFVKTKTEMNFQFLSNRQETLIKEAQKSFRWSTGWDLLIIFSIYILFSTIITDPQSRLVLTLIILQFVYLYINILTISNDFKYR